ncbi:MAG: SRPBCC family protein [Chloroflexi bacterium]|nr:SRPBCC family protein [Chloroflexota bacterium]
MTKVSGEVRINAKRDAVWKVLADLGAVSAWNPTVAKSYYISEAKEGVGSSRHCEFWDGGYVKECATQWEAEKQVRLLIMCSTRPPTFHSLHGVVDSIWSGFTFAMMPRVVSTAA